MTGRIAELLRALGARIVNNWIWRLGFACRFLWFTLKESGASFRRFHLTIREIYFTGVLSLIIILVSGLFVGMVLGLQGYDTLVRYGSSEALGVLVSLSLVRELGPVVAGLLFASRAGSAITAGWVGSSTCSTCRTKRRGWCFGTPRDGHCGSRSSSTCGASTRTTATRKCAAR